jgi:hypothetical protein
LNKILEQGSDWPVSPISNRERLAKNQDLIARGNHKSALKYTDKLEKTLEKEIAKGWVVPLPLNYVSSLEKW